MAQQEAKIAPAGVRVAPSLLSADFSRLQDEIATISIPEVKELHLDVMDGHFVPNITFGPPLVKSIRGMTSLFLDTHLMIADPARYVEPFAAAGSDRITVHYESDRANTLAIVRRIRELGKSAGVSIKPATPWGVIRDLLPELDLVLVMTVEPGFGGQSFMADQLPKIEGLARHLEREGLPVTIEVDGGIGPATAGPVARAGARLLVAGNSVFGQPDRAAAVRAILDAASPA